MEDGNGKGMEWIGKWGSGNVGMECGREGGNGIRRYRLWTLLILLD